MKNDLKQTLKTVKDLILFESKWKKRTKDKSAKKLPQKAIKRLEVYRELVWNSFDQLITKIYPYTYILLKKNWGHLLKDYIEKYPPRSPILNKVAENFPEYLSKQKSIITKYPFIYELALYEWLELEIVERDIAGDFRKGELNPIHEICDFYYDIPEIIEEIKSTNKIKKVAPKKTNILIYRDLKTKEAKFFALSPASRAYIEAYKQGLNDDFITITLSEIFNVSEDKFDEFRKQIGKFNKLLKEKNIIL